MALEVIWTESAQNSLEDLQDRKKKEVLDMVTELSEQQFSHNCVKPIKDRNGRWIWRLKVKEDYTDHKVFVDLEEEKLLILDIAHRDTAYE